jgi:hypothetical protein
MSVTQLRKEVTELNSKMQIHNNGLSRVTIIMWMPNDGSGKPGVCSFPSNRSDLRVPYTEPKLCQQ